MKPITPQNISKLANQYKDLKVQNALRRVLVKNALNDIAENLEQKAYTHFHFSNEIKTLPVANQKASGRCWIFAGLNVLREVIANKYQLKTFELSQNYVAFWDKFEKINYFIESIDDFLDADLDDRTLQHILITGIQDGGQWDMFVSLIEKYGVVPKNIMEETASSSATRLMNQLINVKLRQYVAKARQLKNEPKAIAELKEKTLTELYNFLTTNFGVPPQSFDFDYTNKDGIYFNKKGYTPQSFYQDEIGNILKDYVSIIHAPTKDKPYNQTYTVSYLGNVVGGSQVKYLNLDLPDLKDLVLKQLLGQETVWFGCDVSRDGNRVLGIWDDQSFAYEELFEMDLSLTKAEQLDYRQSAMNHAMVLTGVNLDEGVPNRWKIENSWGDQSGKKGYFLASGTWFDKYVYQAVIHQKHLTKEQLKNWRKEPVILKPWDPMGSLAK